MNGASQAKIFNELGNANYNRYLISRTIKRYNETGGKINPEVADHEVFYYYYYNICTTVWKVRQMLARKPTLSHRKVAARARISRGSACRIISRDLGIKPFKRSKTEALTTQTMKKRVTRCRNLLKWLKTANSDTIVFTDEKIWSVNDRVAVGMGWEWESYLSYGNSHSKSCGKSCGNSYEKSCGKSYGQSYGNPVRNPVGVPMAIL